MLRLPPHRRFPGEAKPGEILVDRDLEFRPAARDVDILDAQQESSTSRARHVEVQQCRTGVAEMEIAVRARRKTENGWRHVAAVLVVSLSLPGLTRQSITLNKSPL